MRYILFKNDEYVTEGTSKYVIDSYEHDILLDYAEWTLGRCSNRSMNALKKWLLIPDNDKITFKRI